MVTHTSDYFDLLGNIARDMISAGYAFMDDTPQEQMREERGNLIESSRRNEPVAENLARFTEMLLGSVEGKRWCMRAKIDMKNDNGTLRDPVMFRCNETPHHRTGTRFKAYPTYDFACPIIDSLEGVTHALRTSEYADRVAQYAWIQETLKVRKVHITEFSRLNFVFTLLSKRKLTWFADNNHVNGWFDPRFPTVQGVLRRGVTVAALREFIIGQGASKRVLDMEWDKFWATNKKHIDPVAPRFTALEKRVPLHLISGEGVPSVPEVRAASLHPKNVAIGTKAVYYSSTLMIETVDAVTLATGEEITLMKWGNAIVRNILHDADGQVLRIDAELHLVGDFKKTEKKISWISGGDLTTVSPPVPLRLEDFDFLITKPKLEEGEDFASFINPKTKWTVDAIGEPAMRGLQRNDIIQIERKGFYRVDEPALGEKPMVLFAIPDGRLRAVGVQAEWIAKAAGTAAVAK
jgi:glutamyl-tRNA synthetase